LRGSSKGARLNQRLLAARKEDRQREHH
jgi:hypothetical protein